MIDIAPKRELVARYLLWQANRGGKWSALLEQAIAAYKERFGKPPRLVYVSQDEGVLPELPLPVERVPWLRPGLLGLAIEEQA